MPLYQINWMENTQTKAGQAKANATLVDQNGNEHPNVTIWGDFPDFSGLRPGVNVEGSLVVKNVKGKNWTTLYASKNPNGTFKPKPKSDMKQVMDIKKENIEHAQDKKYEGIKDASTFRAATDHMIQWREERAARGVSTTTEEWQAEWINSRKWFDARFSEPFN